MVKIAFVGQTPPPYHGQAIMLENILRAEYSDIQLFHVPMTFSKEIDEIGKPNIYKIFHLFKVIAKIYYYRFSKGAKILYYPPAGPNKVPIVRDICILISCRWLFKKTIFHFHAGGVSEFSITSRIFHFLYAKAYYYADCAILLSPLNPPDGKNLRAKKEYIVPYGIEDNSISQNFPSKDHNEVKLLAVSMIKESKGTLILLEACSILKKRNVNFSLEIMGKFESKQFEGVVKKEVLKLGIQDHVSFLGVLSGMEKYKSFNDADIFCFPTFFDSETFGVVLLEAMQFSLPIVATYWRGIPSVVKDLENGFLIEIKNASQLSDKLERLISNPLLRKEMGDAGRKMYLNYYTLTRFQEKMAEIFRTC